MPPRPMPSRPTVSRMAPCRSYASSTSSWSQLLIRARRGRPLAPRGRRRQRRREWLRTRRNRAPIHGALGRRRTCTSPRFLLRKFFDGAAALLTARCRRRRAGPLAAWGEPARRPRRSGCTRCCWRRIHRRSAQDLHSSSRASKRTPPTDVGPPRVPPGLTRGQCTWPRPLRPEPANRNYTRSITRLQHTAFRDHVRDTFPR